MLVLLTVPGAAWAQSEQWLSPKLGEVMLRSDYRLTFYPDEEVKDQHTDFGSVEHRLSLTAPLWQDDRDEWSISGSVRLQEIDTRAVLPDTFQSFPDRLWDIKVSPAYRHRFDNGWIAGASVSVGTASDKPFNSFDELVVRATAFLRVPHGERNAWLFTLNYSNHQEQFEGIPIPGVAYVYSPSDRFTAVLGFPFSTIRGQITEKLSAELTYVPIRFVRARLTYQLFRPLRIYAGFDWDHDSYLLAGRGDKDDQLFYYEKRATAGVRFDLRHVGVELSGGYAFDRYYFEGEGYSDRRENRLDVGAGPFVVLRVGVRF